MVTNLLPHHLRPALSQIAIGTASVMTFLTLWQVFGSSGLLRADLASYPSEILVTALRLIASGELGANAGTTLLEFIEALVLVIPAGIGIGLALASWRGLRYLLDPLLAALYSAPMVAFVPILVFWLGTGRASKVAIGVLGGCVPIIVNTMSGLAEVPEPLVRALRAFGATPRQIALKALLPAALPAIMAGLRLAVGRTMGALISAEIYVSVSGIGRMIDLYRNSDRTAEIFVIVFVTAGFGLGCVNIMRVAERRLAPWRAEP